VTWQVAYEVAYEEWVGREHPPESDRVAVLGWLRDVADGTKDPFVMSVHHPGTDDTHEARIPGTAVYVEFSVLREFRVLGVERLEYGSSFG
jgi:hypothetical protein